MISPYSLISLNALRMRVMPAGKRAVIQPSIPEIHVLQSCTNRRIYENENFEYISLAFHSSKSKKQFSILQNYFPILQPELQGKNIHPSTTPLISTEVFQGTRVSSHKSNSKIKATAGKTQAINCDGV